MFNRYESCFILLTHQAELGNRHSQTGVWEREILIAGIYCFTKGREICPRNEALAVALCPLIIRQDEKQANVARIILDNYLETRSIASQWSGVYWGFTFAAAALSALAALVLKLETLIANEKAKKDLAALLSVVAALLMTISTSGDFQRKWQANRIAAAELERKGYEFLAEEKDKADTHLYLNSVGQIMFKRHMAIVGGAELPLKQATSTTAQ